MGERAFRFRHLLIRDAAYDSIPKTARAELHELFGRWLEERTSDRTPGYEEIIGYHLEQTYPATGPSSGRSTMRPGRSRGRRPSGSAPPATGRSSAATPPQR